MSRFNPCLVDFAQLVATLIMFTCGALIFLEFSAIARVYYNGDIALKKSVFNVLLKRVSSLVVHGTSLSKRIRAANPLLLSQPPGSCKKLFYIVNNPLVQVIIEIFIVDVHENVYMMDANIVCCYE